jgi:hypothetical protein
MPVGGYYHNFFMVNLSDAIVFAEISYFDERYL